MHVRGRPTVFIVLISPAGVIAVCTFYKTPWLIKGFHKDFTKCAANGERGRAILYGKALGQGARARAVRGRT